jgi:transcriptional regulator with XRE-family HTH domain
MRAEEIRAKRHALGMSRTALAAYLGVSYGTVVQWEQSRRVPSMDEFSLRVAFATAERARRAGLPLPDWRTSPVLPEPAGESTPAGVTGGGA